MMMVNPVSVSQPQVRFRGEGANVLERPGAFAKPSADEVAISSNDKAKKSGGKTFLKALAGVVVAAGALVALRKTNVLKTLGAHELADAGFLKKIPHYLAVAGDAVAKYTYEPIAKLISRK